MNPSGVNRDRLSNLPEPIIHYIFSFLETLDVVRARAVSKKWKSLWVSMPYLNLIIHRLSSDPKLRRLPDRLLRNHNREEFKEKFKDFVNWVLLSRNGSIDIKRFRLQYLPDNADDDNTLYRWIRVVAQRNVQELDITLSSQASSVEFPHSLVTFESLLALRLYHCALKLPTNAGFSRLKSLKLKDVDLSNNVLFGNFLSSCPSLENLKMKGCAFSDLNILDISTPSLKNLTVENVEVKVACPNLVSFKYRGPFFSFENVNSLQNIFIYISDDSQHTTLEKRCHNMSTILKGICNTKVLYLCICCSELCEALADPKWFTTTFCNLKSLKLPNIGSWNIQIMINLLDCCPYLEALTLSFRCVWYTRPDHLEIPDKAITCLTYHLKWVELFYGDDRELELVRFLLKNGHVLQKMNIRWWTGIESCREGIQKVINFPRSSSNVALTFLESKSEEPEPYQFFQRFA